MAANEALGSRLTFLRKQRQWTMKQAANVIGIDVPYLCHLERGRLRNPTMKLLFKLADAYGTTLDYLCGRSA